ncbi:MAG: phosphate/phosphite/phosphonate ABC transporter substrate-binding protein [Nitrospirae bacterium]|nr:phosphate/phosphite/phosphonate ABC transporter substrate-binding protein [Nitrospirota bacterium]
MQIPLSFLMSVVAAAFLFLRSIPTALAAEPRPLVLAPVAEVSTTLAEMFQPLADYLSQELDRPIRLMLTNSYSDLLDRFGQGKIDIVFGGPYSFVLARERYGARALVLRTYEGSMGYQTYIFVREDSGIGSLQDLHGKRFAFTDEFSTSGYLVPRVMMHEAGIPDPNVFFSEIKFKRNYLDVIESVLIGEVDGAATASFQFEGFGIRNRSLKVIQKSPLLKLGPVYANPLTLSPKEMEEIKRVFLAIGKTAGTERLEKILGTREFMEIEADAYAWVEAYRKILASLPAVNPPLSEWVLPESPKAPVSSVDPRLKIALVAIVGVILLLAVWKSREWLFRGLGGRILLAFLGLILFVVTVLGGLFYFKEKEILNRDSHEAGLLFTQAVTLAAREAVFLEDKTYLTRYARALMQQRRMDLTSVEIYGQEDVLLASAGQDSSPGRRSLNVSLPVMLKQAQRGEVRIGFSQERAVETLRDTLLNILLIALVTATATIAVAIWLTRRMTRPLAELAAHTQLLAEGDLDRKVEIASDDEIGLLARAFNRMAGELKETTARLYRHEKLADIGLLLVEINHRLRNPIAGINNYAKLLQNKLSPTSPGRKEVDRIREGTEQIDGLLRRLSEPASTVMDFKPIRLDEVLRAVHERIQPEARRRGVEVIQRYDPALPMVVGNRERLVEVFENLLSNALDALLVKEEGDRLIRIHVRKEEGQAAAEIEDTGCGIPEEERSKIFDPFFTTKEKESGTGLGLYIAYTIIERHSGKIHIASQVGKGSRFTVRLPASGE